MHLSQPRGLRINGTPEQTLGEVSLPLQMSEFSGTYSAEVIGGEGSLCPALLSNPALRKQSSALLTNHFENGDGVLIARHGREDWTYMRVLLTDSGHYLLPVDGTSTRSPRLLTPHTVW